MYVRPLLGVAFLWALLLVPAYAAAQNRSMHERRLTQLYTEFLAREGDAEAIEQRITAERSRVRNATDEDLSNLIGTLNRSQTGSDLLGSIERQRVIVSTLQEREREAEFDLELLEKEEENIYLSPGEHAKDSNEFRLTSSHAELLAKRAVLEENVASLTFFITLQQERLQKLSRQRTLEQFSLIITFAKYALLISVFLALERFVRHKLLVRIAALERRYAMIKAFTTTAYGLLLVLVLAKLSAEFPGILTSFAIVGAGIAVALQDVVKDIVGWMSIVQGRKFTVGDRIAIGGFTGDVIDIGPLHTTLLEVISHSPTVESGRSGRTITFPNALTLSASVTNANTSSDYIRVELPVVITYESNRGEAENILHAILNEETSEFTRFAREQQIARMQQFYFADEVTGPAVYVDTTENGVLLILRFSVPVGQRRVIISRVTEKMLDRFAQASPPIELAYRTSRVIAAKDAQAQKAP
jgi:small-conductance mechanosensitive channel